MQSFLIKYYLIGPNSKALLLWLLVLGFSALSSFIEVPTQYFSKKSNFVNVYFLKLSWGWTLAFLTPYMLLTSYVYSENWKRGLFSVFARLAVSTGLWYFFTVPVFHTIENMTGYCMDSARNPLFNISNKRSCLKLAGRHRWIGFDISGHVFILTFCTLLITSELQVQRRWKNIPTEAASYLIHRTKVLERVKSRQKATEKFVNFLFVANCILEFVWVLSMVSTCLYFHTFFSKAVAAIIAISSWIFAYAELFQFSKFPVYPGYGPIKEIIAGKSMMKKLSDKKNG